MRLPHDSWDMKLYVKMKDSSLTRLTISKSSWFIEFLIFYAAQVFFSLPSSLHSFRSLVRFLCRFIIIFFHLLFLMSFPWKWAPTFQMKSVSSHRRETSSQLCNSNRVPNMYVCVCVCVYNNLNWWQPSSWEDNQKLNFSSCILMRTLQRENSFSNSIDDAIS